MTEMVVCINGTPLTAQQQHPRRHGTVNAFNTRKPAVYAATARMFIALAGIAIGLSLPAPATAQTANYVDLQFTGKVEYVRGNNVSLSNPDGSTTTLNSATLPDYLIAPGTEVFTTFRFDANAPAFSNSACAGRVSLNLEGAAGGGSCTMAAIVKTPFGNAGLGGLGGDAPGSIAGLDVIRDPATGALSVDIPSGTYSFRYVGVNPYYYDSSTGTLSGPTANGCVNAFDCPTGSGSGSADRLSFDIPIAGDFGKVRPGYNVGYDAGSAGLFSIIGGFFFGSTSGGGSSSGGPVSVPEPSMLVLFGGASLVLARVRRRRQAA